MAVQEKKIRTFYVMKILLEKTDNMGNMLTAAQIMKELEKYELTVDRKTLYNDIETLKAYGLVIGQSKGASPGYYIEKRDFEPAELKLIVDAVQASKFITAKKTDELIHKIKTLCSEHQMKQLSRQIYIYNRPKTDNETIFTNVDMIHTAIGENAAIAFHYGEWTVRKELKLKKNGAEYLVSPWALVWDDENYYMVAYDPAADMIKHYRVDKMLDVRVLDIKREGKAQFEGFDLASFSKKTFGMFGGKDEKVSLYCANHLAGVIIDRFGTNVMMIPKGPDHFQVHVDVTVSPQFFGWVTGIGKDLQITGPDHVAEAYKTYMEDILSLYKG